MINSHILTVNMFEWKLFIHLGEVEWFSFDCCLWKWKQSSRKFTCHAVMYIQIMRWLCGRRTPSKIIPIKLWQLQFPTRPLSLGLLSLYKNIIYWQQGCLIHLKADSGRNRNCFHSPLHKGADQKWIIFKNMHVWW